MSCPAGNAPLPFVPFPGLAYNATCSAPKIRKRGIACRSPKPSSTVSPGGNNNGGGYGNGNGNGNGNGYENGNGNGHGAQPTQTHQPYPTYTPTPMCEKVAGDSIQLTAAGNNTLPATTYVTFVSGLGVTSAQGTVSGRTVSVAIPAAAMGQTYVFLTSAAAANGKLDTTTVLNGPAIVEGKFPDVD